MLRRRRPWPRPSLRASSSSFPSTFSSTLGSGRTPAASWCLLGPGPGPLAVLGLAGDLAILEIAHLLRADLAVLRIGIAGLAAHRARQLAAALVGPGPLAAAAPAGALHVLAAPGRSRCSSRTSGAAPWGPACRPGRRRADRCDSRPRSSCSPRSGSGPRGRRWRRRRPCSPSHIRRGGSFERPLGVGLDSARRRSSSTCACSR